MYLLPNFHFNLREHRLDIKDLVHSLISQSVAFGVPTCIDLEPQTTSYASQPSEHQNKHESCTGLRHPQPFPLGLGVKLPAHRLTGKDHAVGPVLISK